jgi:uncharacterized membrane protein (UPF0182 family)
VPSINRVALLSGDTTRSVMPPFTTGNHSVPAPGAVVAQPSASAASLYNAMREALRRGDWTAFGRAFEALGRLLGQPAKP